MTKLTRKILKHYANIDKYYNYLINKTKNHEYVGIVNEWLIDNYYIIIEHKNNISNYKKNSIKKFSIIEEYYYYLKNVISKKNYNIDFKLLTEELKKYEKNSDKTLTYKELSNIYLVLLYIYIEKLDLICEEEHKKIMDQEKISSIIKNTQKLSLKSFIADDFNINKNFHYLFEINNQLNKIKNNNNQLFKELNEYLKEKNISLKELINEEYENKINNNILIANIFTNLKSFFDYSQTELYEKVSKTEKKLLTDPIYKKMTDDSKNSYRERLITLAKRNHCDEYTYLEKIMTKNEHIGFKLFKKKNTFIRTIIYLISLISGTCILSFFLSKYFISNRYLGFIILLIPISQLYSQLLNQFLTHFIKPTIIPKLDYTKGIPDEAKTMVVIPTIVKDKEKVKEMFDTLESFYLVNKTDNLYFTLLADAKTENEKDMDYDKEVKEYGLKYSKQLNEKYKKELFYFIYRKRIYNNKENAYLGYERKRGALLQFNKVLLGEYVDEAKHFHVNTLRNNKLNIKYVITLDTDTKLVLNSALNLVGAMNHPMNKPILNKEKTKVISGYGIMQPRIGVDIEATNKSLYSQIFAGIGGFDTYSRIVPNFHQDTFNEGIFVGKGIYDLELFNDLLSETFPDNLILSHDLLESNYLRCGYVSDVELMDDFPSKFLMDVTRQHRWARGDTQIISWLLPKVTNKDGKKVKNPINILGKYKILDNIIRMFLNPMLLLILLLAFTKNLEHSIIWISFVILEITISILFFIRSKMYLKQKERKEVYYKNLYFGAKSILLHSYILFATIPFYTWLYMNAFFKTLYRLFYSHKNLLNWITAEEASKTVKNKLSNYILNFKANYIFGIIFIIIGIITKNYISYIISFIFITAPFVLYYVSIDLTKTKIALKDKKQEEIKEIALKTWTYFDDNLKSKYNYLIPDNYQENREEKLDNRTSPTSIGYSLTSVICAYELEFIDEKKAISLLKNILETIDSLEKWHGHLYNWYNIKTKEPINPYFVSTIDSGNLIACIITVKEFLIKHNETPLVKLCEKLIKNANFKKFYTKSNVFSIGYEESEGRLSTYNYNKFASESRLTSYIAICLGNVPSKHWFHLDKSLTTYHNHKGLISWSGTAFEYYMPLLFMKNYPNTLMDESYQFALLCQKDYINKISHKLPWGISESAYNELDNSLNYKYKAFSVPYLKAKEDKENRIVLSPYASLMAMELYPHEVYNNMKKFEALNMISKYGFYEAYDYDNQGIVRAFFAHHLGMSLVGITNYLKDNAIKNYFHSDIRIKTFEILLKEKVQIKASIDMKMATYKKYNYKKEKIENDIRSFNYISYLPEMTALSNKKYSLIMNDRGNSFSRYRTLQLNRYRKITELDYGIFLFIRDVKTNNIWSNTYAPMNTNPEKYEVIFASDKIKYIRKDNKISTKTEIIVCKNHHGEIRKISFKNESEEDKELELTTYTEPILSENMDDISHKVFKNMFIQTEFDNTTNSLIARRKNTKDSNLNSYMVTRMIIDEPLNDYTYETERKRFIGRNNNLNNAQELFKELSNYTGDNLDPILSLRNRIIVPANGTTSVYLYIGFGRSKEQIKDMINHYNTKETLEQAFRISNLMNVIETKNMNISGDDMRTFNIMLNYLYQTTRISVSKERMNELRKNALGQSSLWKFGISGDRPIISVEINDISNMSLVHELIKAFEYYKNKSIFIDLLIINNEENPYAKNIQKEINDDLYRMYALNSFYHTPGEVFVINSSNITKEEKSLLEIVPRIKFKPQEHESLKDMVLDLQKNNNISDYEKVIEEDNIKSDIKTKLEFDNGFGGFKNYGKEYVIYNKNTPMPWSNIIANKNFGTIVTNNGCGYTYAYNSQEFKISSWTNEVVINDKSEGFKFNNKLFDPEICTHGFGYTILESETKELKHSITEFVALNDNVKIYLLKIKNKNKIKKTIPIQFWINPTFGNFEEKTSRHILTEFNENDNYLKMRNVYSINYGDVNVFISSSEKIKEAQCEKILIKSINTDLTLEKEEEKEIAFILGCSLSDKENIELIKKYTDIKNCKNEINEIKKYWNEQLSTIQIKTPDKSFDYMINGWYLYQTISSRILAKAGFYQVSGAFGYRDQLQDAMNIALINPEYTKKQILMNAMHQFEKGDVLHWWHEQNHFGLRSKYKDDYLWLVYAVINYLEKTEDYDILNEEVPYAVGEELSDYENEKGIVFHYSDIKDTLFNHCIKSLELSMSQLGPHKLPLMGGGDWNDGMNRVGIKGKGESIWLGFFLYEILDSFTKIIKKVDKNYDVDHFIKFQEKLKDNLNKKGWDKTYYLRAYFDNGDKLGSIENSECKIDLISQSFSIISNVIPKERIEEVIEGVEEQLVDKDLKIIKLLTPPFAKSLNSPGYIMDYPKGIRENGGQYTHAVAWYIMALIKAGYKEKAYTYYQMINPINRTKNIDETQKYEVEPYVLSSDIYSSVQFAGKGGWTWYTGSSGWFYRVGIEEILGIKKQKDKLIIKPNIPGTWKDYKFIYKYKNTTYNFEIVKKSKEKIILDGKEQEKNYIILKDDKTTHTVVVNINK